MMMPYYASVHVVASSVVSSSTSVHDSDEPVVVTALQLSSTVSEILVHVNGVNEDIKEEVILNPDIAAVGDIARVCVPREDTILPTLTEITVAAAVVAVLPREEVIEPTELKTTCVLLGFVAPKEAPANAVSPNTFNYRSMYLHRN